MGGESWYLLIGSLSFLRKLIDSKMRTNVLLIASIKISYILGWTYIVFSDYYYFFLNLEFVLYHAKSQT